MAAATAVIVSLTSGHLVLAAPQGAPPEPSTLTADQRSDLQFFGDALKNSSATPEQRTWAARKLLRMQIPSAVGVLAEALRGGDPSLTGPVLTAIEADSVLPEELVEPLTGFLDRTTPEMARQLATILSRSGDRGVIPVADVALNPASKPAARLGAIRVLGEFRSTQTVPRAVEALINVLLMSDGVTKEHVDATFNGLERMTGRGRDERTVSDWMRWWERIRNRPVRDWLPDEVSRLRDQIEALQNTIDSSQTERSALREQLNLAMADVYFLLKEKSSEAVQAKLIEWLRSTHPTMRELATERVEQILRNPDTRLTEEIQAPLVERLDDSVANTRRLAATILQLLNHSNIGILVAERLPAETNADVRNAYLRVLRARPQAETLPELIKSLQANATRDAAAEAVLALMGADELGEASQATVLEAARAAFAASKSRACLRLLASVGSAEDLQNIIALLSHADADVRTSAAIALRLRPEAEKALLTHVNDPAILPTVLAGFTEGPGTLARFQMLLDLPVDQPAREKWRQAIHALGAKVTIADLVGAHPMLQAVPESRLTAAERAAIVNAMLSRVLSAPPDALPVEPRTTILLALARARLALDQPTEAIAALDRANGNGNEEAAILRFEAIVRLGRFDDAMTLDSRAETWLATLGRLVTSSPVTAVALKKEIEVRFPDLSGESLQLFRSLAARLPSREVEPPSTDANLDDSGAGGNETSDAGTNDS